MTGVVIAAGFVRAVGRPRNPVGAKHSLGLIAKTVNPFRIDQRNFATCARS